MGDLLEKKVVIELVTAFVASFIIFQFSFVFFLFIVPVFFIGRQRGWPAALVVGSVLFIAVSIQIILPLRAIEDTELRRFITVYGLSYPLGLLAGTVIILIFSGRSLYKMLIVTLIFGALCVPVILVYSKNAHIVSYLREQISYVTDLITKGLLKQGSGVESDILLSQLQPDKISQTVMVIFFRDFIAAYFFLLSGCWALADVLVSRSNKLKKFQAVNFRAPEGFVWILILSLAGVLADFLFDLGWPGYLFWNSMLILLLVYSVQGIGLIKFLFNKFNVTRRKQRSVYILIFLLLMIPGLNFLVLLGVPGFGVSELWIRYR